MYRMELKSRCQKIGETLQEYSAAVERLVHLAHVNTSPDYMERIKMDAFIDGIRDPETRKAVMLSPKATFAETIACAMINETAQAIIKPSLGVRRVEMDVRTKVERSAPKYREGGSRIRCWACGKMGHISRDCKEGRWRQPRSRSPMQRTSSCGQGGASGHQGIRKVRCWTCDETGHISRDCLETRWRRAESRSLGRRGSDNEKMVNKKEEQVHEKAVGLRRVSCYSIPVTRLGCGGDGLSVKGEVDGQNCNITIDTGAAGTFVREDLVKGKVLPANGLKLRTATGESADIKGRKLVRITIGNAQFQQEVLVAKIVDEVILGMDFMKANGFVVDVGKGVLDCDNFELPLRIDDVETTTRRVIIDHREKRPTNSETVARGKIRVSGNRMKTRDDVRVNNSGFREGDLVWLYNPQRKKGLSPKLQPSWEGPYTIITKINDVVYRIKKGQRGKLKVVHIERLALYRGSELDPVRDESGLGRG